MRMRLIVVSALIALAAPASGTTAGVDTSHAVPAQKDSAELSAAETVVNTAPRPAVMRAYTLRQWKPYTRRFSNFDRRYQGAPLYRSYPGYRDRYGYGWRRPYQYGGFYHDRAPLLTERYRWRDYPSAEHRSKYAQRWVRVAPDYRYAR